MQDNTIGQIKRKLSDSQFWAGLVKVKEHFLRFDTFQLKSGTNIRFLEDIWIENRSLKEQFPQLYRIVRHKHDSATNVFRSVPLNISFRQSLRGDTLQS
jgi:hypothetical protein